MELLVESAILGLLLIISWLFIRRDTNRLLRKFDRTQERQEEILKKMRSK